MFVQCQGFLCFWLSSFQQARFVWAKGWVATIDWNVPNWPCLIISCLAIKKKVHISVGGGGWTVWPSACLWEVMSDCLCDTWLLFLLCSLIKLFWPPSTSFSRFCCSDSLLSPAGGGRQWRSNTLYALLLAAVKWPLKAWAHCVWEWDEA